MSWLAKTRPGYYAESMRFKDTFVRIVAYHFVVEISNEEERKSIQ